MSDLWYGILIHHLNMPFLIIGQGQRPTYTDVIQGWSLGVDEHDFSTVPLAGVDLEGIVFSGSLDNGTAIHGDGIHLAGHQSGITCLGIRNLTKNNPVQSPS
jgi:hypothetical protein